MNNDVDIHELAKMIDSALSSDNPSVKSALYSFMTMAALARAEDYNNRTGPFEKIFKRLDYLEKHIIDIRDQIAQEQYLKNKRLQDKGYRTYSDKTEWKLDTNFIDEYLKKGTFR